MHFSSLIFFLTDQYTKANISDVRKKRSISVEWTVVQRNTHVCEHLLWFSQPAPHHLHLSKCVCLQCKPTNAAHFHPKTCPTICPILMTPTFKLMFHFAIWVLKEMEGSGKQQYVTCTQCSITDDRGAKLRDQDFFFFHKQWVATAHKSLILSGFSLLFNPSYFLLPNSIFVSPLLYSFTTLLSLPALPVH